MNDQPSSCLPEERNLAVKRIVLSEIIALHPERLTEAELVVRLEDNPREMDRLAISDAIGELKRSGLVRFTGDVIEPTHAALGGAEIFDL